MATSSLKILEQKTMKIKHPGFKHFSFKSYDEEAEFKDLTSQQRIDKGHRPYKLKGVDGILVLEKYVRHVPHVEFDDRVSQMQQYLNIDQGVNFSLDDYRLNLQNLHAGHAQLEAMNGQTVAGSAMPIPSLPSNA